jgi:hypothetical protein
MQTPTAEMLRTTTDEFANRKLSIHDIANLIPNHEDGRRAFLRFYDLVQHHLGVPVVLTADVIDGKHSPEDVRDHFIKLAKMYRDEDKTNAVKAGLERHHEAKAAQAARRAGSRDRAAQVISNATPEQLAAIEAKRAQRAAKAAQQHGGNTPK